MSRTIAKTKTDDKPYVSVSLHEAKDNAKTGSHGTYIIRKRLRDESDNLWGVIAENDGVKYRIDVEVLLRMLTIDNIPFVVWWSGSDRHATFTAISKRTPNGLTYFFKTLGDKSMKNNWANVPELKAQSSSLRVIKRLR